MLSHASLHRCRSTRTSFSGCVSSTVGIPYVFATVSICETPTVCAKADQLSSLLHPARGDHGNRLAFPCCHNAGSTHADLAPPLHVPLPGYRQFLIAPWSLTQNHLFSCYAWQCPRRSFLRWESRRVLSVLGRLHLWLSSSACPSSPSSPRSLFLIRARHRQRLVGIVVVPVVVVDPLPLISP